MWHEARKQERKIRGMMVDYKKRAERRREYYEKIKADPTQFLQLHGRRCKVHLDPAVAQAADSPANMMPWQGHTDTLIDRFDGRAHLDHITEYKSSTDVERPPEDSLWEERQASYERYRILVENDFIGISEEKFLMQIYLEEQFGPIIRVGEEDKKKSSDKKAAIGYVYEDSTPLPPPPPKVDDDESKKDSDSDIDLDVTVDVDLLTVEQSKEMNEHSLKYGMVGEDFICMMTRDKEEAESLRLAKEAEEEKAMYSGRKSRRERRAFREKKLQGRKISPPSYAARESPTYDPYIRTKSPSRSRSRSPVDAGKITYITSFGGDISDESGSERRNLPRPGFVSSMTSVIGPSPPAVKSVASCKDKSSSWPSIAKGSSPLFSSHIGAAENKRSITSAPSCTITSSASATPSRSNSLSSSSSSSRSRSRERLKRRNRNGPMRRSSCHTRSHSRSPLESRRRSRKNRQRRSVGRGHSRSSSSDSRSSSSSSNSRSRSRSRSLSRSSSRSRSRSRGSSERMQSSSSPRRYSRGKSHSRSPNGRSPQTSSTNVGAGGASTSAGAVSRYYGRRREQKSDSSSVSMDDDDDDDDDEDENQEQLERQPSSKGYSRTNFRGQNVGGKAVYGTKVQKLTPQERLKRRMQAALNKQYKADKRAEMKKLEKQEQERQDREEELRELAIKLRRRERERRHRRQDSGGGERSPSNSKRGRSRSYSSSRSNSDSSDSSSSSRSKSRSPSAEPPAHSHSGSSSGNSANGSPKPRATKRKSRRRSRSPLVHY